jgi:GNAT superfamily N-acetyltransferase
VTARLAEPSRWLRFGVPFETSTTVQIRPVRYDDTDVVEMTASVQSYYKSIYGTQDEAHVDPAHFEPPDGGFFVAYEDEVPVAMGGWRRLDPHARGVVGERPVEIKRMYVLEHARGRGIARRLLAHLEATAAQAGADWALLETGRPQAAAIRMYRGCGYEDATNFGYYADADGQVSLRKRLTD